jgi:hypothetical protein
MADWAKKGDMKNVDSGPGSKGKSSGGRGAGPRVSAESGNKGSDAGSATEKSHNVEFAKGGNTKMFGEQAAGEQRPGYAEKPDQRGPGEKFAEGGKNKMFGFAGALPATAGISAPRES